MQSEWHEIAGNMHMHTPYSDGTLLHREIAQAAAEAGLDFVIVTDHNIWVQGVEGYYPAQPGAKRQRVLLLVGEEVHDVRRTPQGNHCLVFGAEREVAPFGNDPQTLIDAVDRAGGLSFLAHPHERAAPFIHEDALSWCDWDVRGFTGLEVWNYMSEFKALLRNPISLWKAINHPERGIRGPFAQALTRWDSLLAAGQKVVGIGGADAHGFHIKRGPLERIIFPYRDLFRAVNTHLLLPKPLTGQVAKDKAAIYQALATGHAWIGYDLPHPTTGFRFSGAGWRQHVVMGDEIRLIDGVTLQARIPIRADIRLIRNGMVIHREPKSTNLTYNANETGVYRVEIWLQFEGRPRTWILSNPIYVTT